MSDDAAGGAPLERGVGRLVPEREFECLGEPAICTNPRGCACESGCDDEPDELVPCTVQARHEPPNDRCEHGIPTGWCAHCGPPNDSGNRPETAEQE